MHWRSWLLSAFSFLCGILVFGSISKARTSERPQSFYTVTNYFSDFLLDSYEEILDVTSDGNYVRVRVIRISSANRYCGGYLVRAAEQILPNTTINKLAGSADLCSFTGRDVTAALEATSLKAISDPSDSATLSIVTKCGTKETVLEFPYPGQVDLKALHQKYPRVSTLWDLSYKIRRHAFGKDFSLLEPNAEREKEFENLGTKLLPELVSGKFDAGFGDYTCGNQKCDTNYLAWLLRAYVGPPAIRDPASVELINASSLHLVKYELPKYAPIAKAAHLSGEVRLRIETYQQSGLVKNVQLVSGNALLGSLAVSAAKGWQFSPGTMPAEPVEAVLRFSLCPSE